MTKPKKQAEREVWSVSRLNDAIKGVLEVNFSNIWISGEISDLSRPQSGHIYFTLKDQDSQIKGIIWRSTAERLRFDLDDGLEIVCQGAVDVYPARGSYQFIIRKVEPLGLGALQLAFKQRFEKLAAEGLFDPARKRRLPLFPRHIAFVTSPTGAAVRDFLEVLRRRWHGVQVTIVPARVQGAGAAEEIAAGIMAAARLNPTPDVVVVGRGGGSLEDLWCFNEEIVVRAIHASPLPIISAVGHEIDVTLSDLVADVRAATPTEAAERVVPAMEDIQALLRQQRERLTAALRSCAAHARARWEAYAQQRVFRRPYELVQDRSRRLDDLAERAARALRQHHARLSQTSVSLAARLEALSPVAVLARGYSVTMDEATGQIVRDAKEVIPGQRLRTRLASGQVVSRVEECE